AAQADATGVVPRVRMVLSGTMLYSMSEGVAELHAVDVAKQGRELWAYTLPGTKTAPLVAQVEMAGPGAPVVSPDKAVVYAAAFTADPTNPHNTMQGAAQNPQQMVVAALDSATGKPRWQMTFDAAHWDPVNSQTTPETAFTLPVDLSWAKSGVLIAHAKYVTIGIDPASGKELWRLDKTKTLRTDDAGNVFAVTTGVAGGQLLAFDATTGAVGAPLLSGVMTATVLRSSGATTLLAVTQKDTPAQASLVAVSGNAATVVGQFEGNPSCPFQPGTSALVCVAPTGELTLYDPATAAVVSHSDPTIAPVGPTVFGSTVYVTTGKTGLAYGPDGKQMGAGLAFNPVLVNEYGAVSVTGRKIAWYPVL
ncbi:MAG: PQQ-binding-like beta-propeller repeat protein, partial [Propionibacteriaceae bacterium]